LESNNAEPDSEKDKKNGQKDEEEESSEGEEFTGSFISITEGFFGFCSKINVLCLYLTAYND